jgi:hypothetical protein
MNNAIAAPRVAARRVERLVASPVSWLVLVCAAARVLYHLAGVRFDMSPLYSSWQYIDVELMRSALVRSLFYLHSQPPAFNLFLGTIVKVFPDPARAFHGIYVAIGFALHVMTYLVMRRLRVPMRLALAVAVILAISPAAILYENWLFYTHPLAALLIASALCLHRYLTGGRRADGVAFFGVLMVIALTRSLFHLSWCLVTVALVLRCAPRPLRRRSLACAGIPLAIVLSLYVKNTLVFEQFTASSWLGMNVANLAIKRLDPARRESLIQAGILSPIARVPPFSPVDAYSRTSRDADATGAVLTAATKTGGSTNYNHVRYLAVSQQYLQDALRAVRSAPDEFLRNVRLGLQVFALPSSDHWLLDTNRDRIRSIDHLYNVGVYGTVRAFASPTRHRPPTFDADYLQRHRSYVWICHSARSGQACWPSAHSRDGGAPSARTRRIRAHGRER